MSELNDSWVDCLAEYKATLSSMKSWDVSCPPHIDKDNIISSPEVMDPKTDTGASWKKYGLVRDAFAPSSSNPVRDVSTLTADELIEVMDTFFVKESLYLKGVNILQTIFSFVYLHDMELLAKRSPLLHLYVRCVIRTLVLTIEHVSRAQLLDTEEAIMLPAEIPHEMDIPTETLLAELDVVSKQATDPRVRARMSFRFFLLRMLHEVTLSTKSKSSAAKWFGVTKSAQDALATITRTNEVVTADKSLFRHEDSIAWLSVIAVLKEAPLPPFQEAVAVFRDIVTQVNSLSQLLEIQNLTQITVFLDGFSQKKPVLLTRSLACLFLLSEEPMVSFLGRPSIVTWLWKMFDVSYGAPIFGLVAEGNDAVLRDVVNFRGAHLLTQLDSAALERYRQESIVVMRQWAAFIVAQFLGIWRALLCNRGRAHRRLVNLLQGLADVQRQTLKIEHEIFLIAVTGLTKISPEEEHLHINRAAVLSNFTVELIAQVMQLIVSFSVQLDLLAPVEFIPTHWLLSYLQGVRQDNFTKLHTGLGPQLPPLPAVRSTKKTAPTVNPLLTRRVATTPHRTVALQVNLNRTLADSICQAAYGLRMGKYVSFDLPSTSLVSADTIFNNRFRDFMSFSAPMFVNYATIEKAIEAELKRMLADEDKDTSTSDATKVLKKLTLVTKRTADEAKQLLGVPDLMAFESEMVSAAERTARSLSASVSMLQAMDAESLKKFRVTLEAPYRPSFMTVVLKRN